MLNIILFGPPGSGKGTQALKLAAELNLTHISTGDIFRNEIKGQTPLGLEAQKFMDQGLLVPDEVVIGMLSTTLDTHLANGTEGFIFDGFPRTVPQAEALDKLMSLKKMEIKSVLSLEVSEAELTQRILKRGESSGRADDMDLETIRKRVTEYKTKTKVVASHYEKAEIFVPIQGEGDIEDIFAALLSAINE